MASNYHGLSQGMRKQIYRSRKEVFIDRKQWKVESYEGGDIESDEYDDCKAYYLCTLSGSSITGCVRLRPSTSPTLMIGPFKWLKESIAPSELYNDITWEASRFFITPGRLGSAEQGRFDRRTHALFLSMIEFGMTAGISDYEVVVDAMMARILRMSGWPLRVLSSGVVSLNEKVYYGLLPCNGMAFENIINAANKQRMLLVSQGSVCHAIKAS